MELIHLQNRSRTHTLNQDKTILLFTFNMLLLYHIPILLSCEVISNDNQKCLFDPFFPLHSLPNALIYIWYVHYFIFEKCQDVVRLNCQSRIKFLGLARVPWERKSTQSKWLITKSFGSFFFCCCVFCFFSICHFFRLA